MKINGSWIRVLRSAPAVVALAGLISAGTAALGAGGVALCVGGVALSFGTDVVRAQNASSTSGAKAPVTKIAAVHFTGGERYGQAHLLAASGLKLGQPFSIDALDEAATNLGRSGLLQEVRYHYQTEGFDTTATFMLKDAPRLYHCEFENFVWFAPEEIDAYLRQELPLYDGVVADTGDFSKEINAALTRMLSEHGVSAQVDFVRGTGAGAGIAYVFQPKGINITVKSVQFEGASGVDPAILAKGAQGLVGQPYSSVDSRRYARDILLPSFTERGYLRAKIGAPKIAAHQESSTDYAVELTYPVDSGDLFHWDGATWSGNQILSTKDLDAMMPLKQGDVADSSKIAFGWKAALDAYGKRGYIDAEIKPDSAYDETAHLVRYNVPVTEGETYKMGTVSFAGMAPPIAEKLQKKWKLAPGAVFNASYPDQFAESTKNEFGTLKPQAVLAEIVRDSDKHVANVVMHYRF
jgi:outer membrane protein insertion porin family